MKTKTFVAWLVIGFCLAGPRPCGSAENKTRANAPPKAQGGAQDQPQPAAGEPLEVEFFAAIKSGQLQVAVVPHSYSVMTLRARNNTPQPLKVALPSAFAAIPTARLVAQRSLAQLGHPPSLGDGYIIDPNGSQGLAGSMYGPWTQIGAAGASPAAASDADPAAQAGGPDAPPIWLLAPGQVIQGPLPCFCLEFGKPDPNRRIPYQLVELRDLNNLPAVQELLDRFGKEGLDQRVVQLAAWHVANGVPWHVLAKIKYPRSTGRGGSNVSPQELMAAKQLSESLPSYGASPSLGDR